MSPAMAAAAAVAGCIVDVREWDLAAVPPLEPHPLAPPLHVVERGKGGEV